MSIQHSSAKPTFYFEKMLIAQGFTHIAGVDEAGCGAWAGPVVAAAVMLAPNSRLGEVRDSKLLSVQMREALYPLIVERAQAWGVGIASVEEIFSLGIRQATYLAMRRALGQIHHVEYALVDAWTIPGLAIPQQGIVKGDRLVKTIAAASVVAKVTRDRLLCELAQRYPEYRFDRHKGYGTRLHQNMLKKYGPSPVHRMKFKPLFIG